MKNNLRWKVWMWNRGRQIFLVILEWLWKWIIRRFYRPDFIFLVYGQERHKRACWSERTERRVGLLGLIGFIGYKKNSRKLRGLILASTVTMEEFAAENKRTALVADETRRRFPKVLAIALAGQLPGWLARATGAALNPPLLGGIHGTCFTVHEAARSIAAKLGKARSDLRVAVAGGAGYTGSAVVKMLAQEYGRVIAYDARLVNYETGNVRYTRDPLDLGLADIVILLTAKGDDVAQAVRFISPRAIVADDTHPTMNKNVRRLFAQRGIKLVKVTVTDGSVRMFPRLPDFRSDDVPGCLLEALVLRLRGPDALDSQEKFNRAAEELGFRARLKPHQNDA